MFWNLQKISSGSRVRLGNSWAIKIHFSHFAVCMTAFSNSLVVPSILRLHKMFGTSTLDFFFQSLFTTQKTFQNSKKINCTERSHQDFRTFCFVWPLWFWLIFWICFHSFVEEKLPQSRQIINRKLRTCGYQSESSYSQHVPAHKLSSGWSRQTSLWAWQKNYEYGRFFCCFSST